MTKHIRRRNRYARPRYTAIQKRELLRELERAHLNGETIDAAARRLNVSAATIYRWKRQKPSSEVVAAPRPDLLSVDEAIARLASSASEDSLKLREALFRFLVWLRWPTLPSDQQLGLLACVTSDLLQRGASTIQDLDGSSRELLLRHLDLEVLHGLGIGDLAFPFFEIWNIHQQPFDEHDVIANVVWFLIAYDTPTSQPWRSPSLKKAAFLLKENAFKHKWSVEYATFRRLWSENAPAAPFRYVERFHPGPDWRLDPADRSFYKDVDHILADREGLRLYFARCKWALEKLSQRLAPKAFNAIRFPGFPPGLDSAALALPMIPPEVYAALRLF